MRLTHRPALSCVAFRLGARCLRAPPRASSASCWEQPPQCLPCGPLLAAADGGSSQQHEVVRDEDLPHSNRSVLVPPGDRRQKGRLQYTQKEMSGSSARNCGSAMNQLSRSVFEVSLACSIVLSHVAPARSATNFRRAFSQNKLRVWRSLRCGNRRYSHRWWKTCGGEVSRSSLACLACLVRCPLLPLARDSATLLSPAPSGAAGLIIVPAQRGDFAQVAPTLGAHVSVAALQVQVVQVCVRQLLDLRAPSRSRRCWGP